MNFLAHCLIGHEAAAGTDRAGTLLAGGFLGDFIKGRVPPEMPVDLALGVRLHRRVDAFSNQLAGIRRSCERFPAPLRRIAPILVDILCDHLLTLHWERYGGESLEAFTARVYRQVRDHDSWLTPSGQEFLAYAERRDLLAAYGDFGVTARAMGSITRRLKREELNPLISDAVPPLLADLSTDFHEYFPEILSHATDWVATQDVAGQRQS